MFDWRLMLGVVVSLGLAACEPEGPTDMAGAGFEDALRRAGLAPVTGEAARTLFSDATFYGRYAGAPGGWIEYYSATGVSVFQPDASQSRKRRVVHFGIWWLEEDKVCFSYSDRRPNCFRVYPGEEKVWFVQAADSETTPAGALVVEAQEIHRGNSENYPFVRN